MSSTSTSTLAPVLEVFASIQGEGAWVGEPQVFLRLRGCPMRCTWCDTPGSWKLSPADRARIAAARGARHEEAWASPFQAACWIAEAEPAGARTISITGGEPLLWPDFLLALAKMVGERPLHLETAGGHPDTLARVIDAFRHVSLDLKLAADLEPPVELQPGDGAVAERAPVDADDWRAARRRSLELVRGRDACAKVVVRGGRPAQDYEPLFEDLLRVAPEVPLYLQPVTPMHGVVAPTADELCEVVETARDLDLGVRVVPQVHRALQLP